MALRRKADEEPPPAAKRRFPLSDSCRRRWDTVSAVVGATSGRLRLKMPEENAKRPERICRFAMPGPLREQLIGAVLRGDKTATSSLLVEWELDHEALPEPGERQIVVDSDDQPVAVIELLAVDVIRLGEADLELALAEGEGFESVAEWREAHERFWREEVIPRLPRKLIAPLNDAELVVVERFQLVS